MTTRKKLRRIKKRFPQFRLSIQEDKLYRLMARDYLHYLGNKRPKAEQLKAIQNLLCRVWVRRAVLFDPCLTAREKQSSRMTSQQSCKVIPSQNPACEFPARGSSKSVSV